MFTSAFRRLAQFGQKRQTNLSSQFSVVTITIQWKAIWKATVPATVWRLSPVCTDQIVHYKRTSVHIIYYSDESPS